MNQLTTFKRQLSRQICYQLETHLQAGRPVAMVTQVPAMLGRQAALNQAKPTRAWEKKKFFLVKFSFPFLSVFSFLDPTFPFMERDMTVNGGAPAV